MSLVIEDGALFPNAKWNDPSVLAESSGYTMFASAGIGFSGDISIYRLRSTDRMNWSLSPTAPVLVRSANGWDKRAVETPSVVKFGGKYHMFYTGYPLDHNDTKSYRIGHATASCKTCSWQRDAAFLGSPSAPDDPVPNMDFHQWVVAEPGAVVFNGRLHVYFSAIGANAQTQTDLQTIGLITSADGVTWSSPVMVLMPDQAIYPRSAFYGFSTPAACTFSGRVYLFFSVIQADPWKQVAIGNAWSADGASGWQLNTLPVLQREYFPWTTNEIRSPAPLVQGSTMHLWFAGDDGANLGIGYASQAVS